MEYIETMKTLSEMIFSLSSALNTNESPVSTKEEVEESPKPVKEQPALKQIKESKEKTPSPKPDDSTSSIQGTGTAGYCYVGEWKGIRSCVKVDKTTPCKTQKYSTEELCVNPTLRP
jgi:hypothetical protein